jgi:hypothetical protein
MGEEPAPTPQALRHGAERAIRLAHGILDEPAKAALLALAQELLEKAAQLEAATPTGTAGTTAAMLETTDGKPPEDEIYASPSPRSARGK